MDRVQTLLRHNEFVLDTMNQNEPTIVIDDDTPTEEEADSNNPTVTATRPILAKAIDRVRALHVQTVEHGSHNQRMSAPQFDFIRTEHIFHDFGKEIRRIQNPKGKKRVYKVDNGFSLELKDFKALMGNNWFTDNIMETFTIILSTTCKRNKCGRYNVKFHGPTAWLKAFERTPQGKYRLDQLWGLANRVSRAEADIHIVPRCAHNHCFFLVFRPFVKKWHMCDPYGATGREAILRIEEEKMRLKALMKLVIIKPRHSQYAARRTIVEPIDDFSAWEHSPLLQHDNCRQKDGHSCGPLTCMMIYELLRTPPISMMFPRSSPLTWSMKNLHQTGDAGSSRRF